MKAEWNSQGLSMLHEHEREAFDLGAYKDAGEVQAGELYQTPDGDIWVHDDDGNHRLLGRVLTGQEAADADRKAQIADATPERLAEMIDTLSQRDTDLTAREAALDKQMSAINAKLDALVAAK